MERIKQTLANNGYPQRLVEDIITQKLDNMTNTESINTEQRDDIRFFVALRNVPKFVTETRRLKEILNEHVITTDPHKEVKIQTYYRPYKLAGNFSTRSRPSAMEKSGVVYSFKCKELGCQAQYIGHSTQTLLNRIKQHRYRTSGIYKHYEKDHGKAVPVLEEFKANFCIVYASDEPIRIKIVEALKIKCEKPFINAKYDGINSLLKLF